MIAPPFYRLMGSHYNGLHLGIAYIAAFLRQYGHEVTVYNADYYDTDKYLDQVQLLNNYSLYKTILNDPSHPIWNEIRDKISGFNADFIGITMMTANYKSVRNIAKIARSLNAECKIVVGGVHPTIDPERTLAHEEFDYVICGEGELTFLELANGLKEEEIKGLSFKEHGRIVHNDDRAFIENLDTLPFPNRDNFLNDIKYLDVGYVSTSRGCPFSCAYCVSPQLWNRRVRLRSVSNVLDELRLLKRDYNSPIIRFIDDTFTLNKRRAKEICQRIIDDHLDIKWVCDTRGDCLDDELIALMKQSGCIRIKIGVESGSNKILKNMRKGLNLDTILKAINIIKKHDLPFTVYLLAGFPGETTEDLRQTIKFARCLDADYYSLGVLAPYYGTQVWSDLEKAGKKLDKEHWEYFYHQSQDMILNDGLDLEVIGEFFALNDKGKGQRA